MDQYTVEELNERIQADTFLTLTAKQAISTESGMTLHGSIETYDRVTMGLYSAVEQRCWGKRQRRRRRHPLINLTVAEKSIAGRWHIHACIRRPPHVSIQEFDNIVQQCWGRSRWSLPIIEVEPHRGRGVGYILKTGQDAILTESSHF